MTRKDLSTILKKQIPLSKAMGIRVAGCSVKQGVKFYLPLAPNRNHKRTAFGGTLVAAQALACWAWLMALLDSNKVTAAVVVQRQNGEFLRPVKSNFTVRTRMLDVKDIQRFLRTLERHGKARITISAEVLNNRGEKTAAYAGEYVAIKND